MGSVTIQGVASALPSSGLPSGVVPAEPTSDFSSSSVSLVMGEGITTGLLNITLPENSVTDSLKVFQFSLTSVQANSPISASTLSPRLSADNTTATISILDDEGGTGIFQLNPTSVTVSEGSTVTFSVIRSGGASGRVSIIVQTLQSGLATSGEDFESISRELTFENGVSQLLISVNIFNDDTPEPAEDFSISLSSPSNQMVLIEPSAVSPIS